MITGDEAVRRIQTEFPELTDSLHNEIVEGLLHLQIAEFSRLAQRRIDDGNRPGFKRVCELFRVLFLNGAPDLVNALNVSFLEHLNFANGKSNRAWAYQAMPELMRKAFDDMAEYNRKIHGN